jgi:N-acetyl-alpha-D-muramate 1-phosphate uridylyltransferase
MRPKTESIPKALLPVAGKPFVHHQLTWLSAHGVSEVLFLTGHLGELIEDYVGNGGQWDVRATFSREEGSLLGTGGALRLAAERGLLAPDFLLTYGDSYLRIDFKAVFQAWQPSNFPALMTVFRNQGALDTSNVVLRNGHIELYSKAATPEESVAMEYIDYGLLAFREPVIKTSLPLGEKCDLAPLLSRLSREGQLMGMEVQDRFYEIGSPQGLQDLEQFLQKRKEL